IDLGNLKFSRKTARHVEYGIAGVLCVEKARAHADRPVACGTPRNSEARSEIRLIRLDEIGTQPPIAGGTNAPLSDCRKDNVATIKIAASVFDNAGSGVH